MGMGDKKRKYEPHYGKVLDVVYNKYFAECSVQECPHPAVIKRYGTGGIATVSIYVCKKCKYGIKSDWCGGWSCGYSKLGESVELGGGIQETAGGGEGTVTGGA